MSQYFPQVLQLLSSAINREMLEDWMFKEQNVENAWQYRLGFRYKTK